MYNWTALEFWIVLRLREHEHVRENCGLAGKHASVDTKSSRLCFEDDVAVIDPDDLGIYRPTVGRGDRFGSLSLSLTGSGHVQLKE
jgi:hypothetical protein